MFECIYTSENNNSFTCNCIAKEVLILKVK